MKTILKAMMLVATASMFAVPALAEGTAPVAEGLNHAFASVGGMYALAAGLAIAIASFGGVMAQSKVAATALDGTARNPAAAEKFTAPLFVGLALIESLVILSFVISFMLVGQNASLLKKVFGIE